MPARKAFIVGQARTALSEALQMLDEAGLGQTSAPHIALAVDHLEAEKQAFEALAKARGTPPD